MPRFRHETRLPFVPADVFAWHARPGAFERLSPPWGGLRLVSRTGTIRDGDETCVELEKGPLHARWRLRHRDFEAGRRFVDEQASGPFQRWVHTHRFEPDGDGTVLVDEIEWEPPAAAPDALAAPVVERELARVFPFRARRLRNDLELHARWRDRPRQRVAITGSSGLIGSALRHFLTTGGHTAVPVLRLESGRREEGALYWSPERGQMDADALAGVDGVVHLAGEPLVQLPRWTDDKKARILGSRVQGTELIARAVAAAHRGGPRVLLSAAAVGYYGDRGDEPLTEGSGSGRGFLAEVVQAWEGATRRARGAGVRVALLRNGPVLSPAGGMLEKVLIPFRMGMGGRVGSGRQYVSWIDLDDALGAVLHGLMDPGLEGPVNVTAPDPVPNAVFADILGRVLGRPSLVPVPALVVKAALGQMGEETLLFSQRARPARLRERGYGFLFHHLEDALRFELGRMAA